MDDEKLLQRLREGSKTALETVIDRYSGYVYTTILNRGRGLLSPEDAEETTADVFVTLWKKSSQIQCGKLRAWLGTVARNAAVDRMRKQGGTVPLEEPFLTVPDEIWESLQAGERAELVKNALDSLGDQDKEIFLRYYDLCQSMKEIAAAMHLGLPAVKMRLHRGRKQLKTYFMERGIGYEDCV